MRRAGQGLALLAAAALVAVLVAAPVASGARKKNFPEKLEQRYLAACSKAGAKEALCECMLPQLEKRMSPRQLVRYVVALEHKRKPSKVIIRKATLAGTACLSALS